MKSKKGSIVAGIIIILIVLLIFFLIGRSTILTAYDGSDYQDYCEYKYGKYFHQSHDGGTFRATPIRYCFSISEEGDLDKHYFMSKQAQDVCKKPGFFELNKWSVDCGVE